MIKLTATLSCSKWYSQDRQIVGNDCSSTSSIGLANDKSRPNYIDFKCQYLLFYNRNLNVSKFIYRSSTIRVILNFIVKIKFFGFAYAKYGVIYNEKSMLPMHLKVLNKSLCISTQFNRNFFDAVKGNFFS